MFNHLPLSHLLVGHIRLHPARLHLLSLCFLFGIQQLHQFLSQKREIKMLKSLDSDEHVIISHRDTNLHLWIKTPEGDATKHQLFTRTEALLLHDQIPMR